ncbi:hypothetical protein BZG35_11820 [Brevundimonas sp. LM2]|uniref:hypothetical protein n=1 Tax=Brevundimonas sp. LM2 TaxID=1938605 RepID=UPI00098401DD|nr:hypothetical protein [Brevundimonas sp. LM2]AQR62252.1 hypothetical protein BZG35_11820 [Brevundimonas sp. LM2]
MADDSELERLRARRGTTLFRLDLIAKGARLTYENGTPIDMASEKDRLTAVVADLDRRFERLERTLH